MIIYNVPGALMIAAGVGVGLSAHVMGLPPAFASAVAGVVMAIPDAAWRLKGGGELIDASGEATGGMLYYLPIWMIGMLVFVAGMLIGFTG